MQNKAGMKFDCIFEEPLDFIDIDYTHLNKTVRYEQRSHGEWILVKPYTFACSLCGRLEEHQEPFCNCGAKMEIRVGEAE